MTTAFLLWLKHSIENFTKPLPGDLVSLFSIARHFTDMTSPGFEEAFIANLSTPTRAVILSKRPV